MLVCCYNALQYHRTVVKLKASINLAKETINSNDKIKQASNSLLASNACTHAQVSIWPGSRGPLRTCTPYPGGFEKGSEWKGCMLWTANNGCVHLSSSIDIYIHPQDLWRMFHQRTYIIPLMHVCIYTHYSIPSTFIQNCTHAPS